jgi:hypothetical protein
LLRAQPGDPVSCPLDGAAGPAGQEQSLKPGRPRNGLQRPSTGPQSALQQCRLVPLSPLAGRGSG